MLAGVVYTLPLRSRVLYNYYIRWNYSILRMQIVYKDQKLKISKKYDLNLVTDFTQKNI